MDRRTKRRTEPTLLRLAPAAAEEAHICEGLVPRGDHDRVVLAVVALTYSRAVWAEFRVDDAEDAGLCAVLEHAWDFFGGVPRTWLFETRVGLTPQVLELARRRGATARPYAQREWMGRGEWALRCVPERFLRPHLLRDLGLANRSLHVFVEEMLQRDHPGQRDRRVYELLAEERGYLRPAGKR